MLERRGPGRYRGDRRDGAGLANGRGSQQAQVDQTGVITFGAFVEAAASRMKKLRPGGCSRGAGVSLAGQLTRVWTRTSQSFSGHRRD